MKKVSGSWHRQSITNTKQLKSDNQDPTTTTNDNTRQSTTWQDFRNNFHWQLQKSVKTNLRQLQPTSYSCRKHFKTLDTKEIYSMAKLYSWWRSIASENAYRELVRGQNLFNSSNVVSYLFLSCILLFYSWIRFVLAPIPHMHSLRQ